MLHLNLPGNPPSPRILCLGAHSDDIEIGCGGTVLRLLRDYPAAEVTWVVFSASGARNAEARDSAGRFLQGAARHEVLLQDFRDGHFPYIGSAIKEFFEKLNATVNPDLVFTHYRHDLHQDHRVVSELTWNTFRNHLILEYEIIKYDGDFGSPNLFVPLPPDIAQQKIANLLDAFKTQTSKAWFTADTFSSVMRLRGIESNAPDQHAEAFYCRKLVL